MISEAILIPKIYARLQEIASNFSKFSGGGHPDPPTALAPSALGSGKEIVQKKQQSAAGYK